MQSANENQKIQKQETGTHKIMRSVDVSSDKTTKIENKVRKVKPISRIYKIQISFLSEKEGEFSWKQASFSFQEFENKKLEQPARYDLNKIDRINRIGITICDGKLIDVKYTGVLNETNVKVDENEIPGEGDPISYLLIASFPK